MLSKYYQLIFSLALPIASFFLAIPFLLLQITSALYTFLISASIVLLVKTLTYSVCTGPKQVKIAAALAPAAQIVVCIGYPVSLAVAKIVQLLRGVPRKSRYNNEVLREIIELVCQEDGSGEQESVKLRKRLLSGAIDIKKWTAEQIMTSYDDVFAINVDEPLTEAFIKSLKEKGYSRYPVYQGHKNQVIGVLLVKKLLGLNTFGTTLRKLNVQFRRPLVISPSKSLIELLVEMRKGRSHMALVTDYVKEVQRYIDLHVKAQAADSEFQLYAIKGIVTLEDVTEKTLGG